MRPLQIFALVFGVIAELFVAIYSDPLLAKVICMAGIGILTWFIGWGHPDRFTTHRPPPSPFGWWRGKDEEVN